MHAVFVHLFETHLPTAALGIGTMVLIVLLRKINPKLPGALISMVVSSAVVFFLGLDQLLSVIAAYVGIPIRRGGWWRNHLMRWRARLAGYFARGEEIEG